MPAGSAIRNRSEIVTVVTPRGGVEVARQEIRGLRRGSSWTWFWLARRKGASGWSEAPTAREAIRRAMLLPPRKLPGWLNEAAAEAERELAAVETSPEAAAVRSQSTHGGTAAQLVLGVAHVVDGQHNGPRASGS
jgi:hypothetical protein